LQGDNSEAVLCRASGEPDGGSPAPFGRRAASAERHG
jgi:hypothetical protein